ncbi:saccharopine dehydrogenase NADP-binding domain-containing protein [Aquincola sp. S2]|uniref:Saccharopine dehydrogenase NADP-binding domain-containing protein n=2 Tax=Pseudaquabacterium terrae TaxID=2732868 RepID=A0ABX2EFX4_9BURK|nr:saccharopine dehydrogenase NADP-binding domain-containing protein [Aquabacterium terrae]
MNRNGSIAVYGAGGHTGRFVVQEARRRGLPVIAVGRDAASLPVEVERRTAAIDDAAALQRAFAGCSVVINCAGPFLDTALPVARAAIRAGCGYIDVTAEQASALACFDELDAAARAAGVAVIPAAGFYGGLADLLASTLVRDAAAADVTVAVALDHWWPTAGTRKTGERNQVPRQVIEDGRLITMPLPARRSEWTFDAPHGVQQMVELPFSEVITIGRHLRVRALRSLLASSSLEEIRDVSTPAPLASDEQGRSAQRFEMVVQVREGAHVRRAAARGRDIYAVSAPLVIEAAERMRQSSFDRMGAMALGEAFDVAGFLHALAPEHLELQFVENAAAA